MVKKHCRRLPATSTPTTASASGERMTSKGIWWPWCDSPHNSLSGHVVQQTARTPIDVDQLTDVTSSPGTVTSFPVTDRQHSRLWSPYSDAEVGELSLVYSYADC